MAIGKAQSGRCRHEGDVEGHRPLVLQSLRPSTEVPNARHSKQPKNCRKGVPSGHGKTAEKQLEEQPKHPKTWWTFRIFIIFFCSGEGKGAVRGVGRRGGGRFFIENPRGGGLPGGGAGGGEGPEGVCGDLGGGGKYFFSGPKFPPPKGPEIEKIQDRPPGLKFSIEIENFNLDTPSEPLFFVGNSEGQD